MKPGRQLARSYRAILGAMEEARRLASDAETCAARADAVSAWNVQQQLDHLELTGRRILEGLTGFVDGRLDDSPPARPSLRGRFVLWTGHIPRGKARAPEMVLPSDRPLAEIEAGFGELIESFEGLKGSLGEIQASSATYRHPILGDFNGVQWMRFAYVHHRHHEKIISDILRAAT